MSVVLPVLVLVLVLGTASCGGTSLQDRPVAGRTPDTSAARPADPVSVPTTTASTTAPAPTTTTQAPFVGTVSPVTAADLPSTWRPGCPVGPEDLSMLHMSYWGFDDQPHVGTMVVATSVSSAVLKVFGTLYTERFPIRQMVPVDAFGGSDAASTAADNTAGFNCRYAVAPGPPQWSAHAYGEAIDVNTVENPYIEGGQVLPPNATAYVDRSDIRPGMAYWGGELVDAFASVGWQWGGRWSDPDYQHFSATGN